MAAWAYNQNRLQYALGFIFPCTNAFNSTGLVNCLVGAPVSR